MPARKPATTKDTTARARLEDDLRGRLTAINQRHGTNDTEVLTNLIAAFCAAVEQEDAVRYPLLVMLAEKRQLVAAEDADRYLPGQKGGAPPGKALDKGQRTSGAGPTGRVPKTA